MKDLYKFFLSFFLISVLIGCQKSEVLTCSEISEQAYEQSTLTNFEKNKFRDLLKSRFQQYEEIFKLAGKNNEVDWELLAAISFQESQWDRKAKSSMGVRGMMMVTLETAASVGIKNRLDAKQSIEGGSKYFASLLNKNIFGKSIQDQVSITLASYNLGPTNIINIAEKLEKEPDEITWTDFEKALKDINGEEIDLLNQKNYPRGQQAIDYVNRTKDYYELMKAYSCSDSTEQ
jgi:membrane-bound lytic murein transglycosylase F